MPALTQSTLQSLAREIGPEAQVIIIGRADDGSVGPLGEARAKMLSAVLRTAGHPRANTVILQEAAPGNTPREQLALSQIRWVIPVSPPAHSLPPAATSLQVDDTRGVASQQRFDMWASDGDVATTLRRWGRQHGYQVVWEAPMQAPVHGDVAIQASGFADALAQVLGGLQQAGYAVTAYQQAPNVVRITGSPHRR
ncbi:MAG: TcpQ domain-containing protein [Pseudomonadota bacterium]